MSDLVAESVLVLPNPAEAVDDSETDGFIVKSNRHGNPHSPIWRIHRKVQILDVFANDFDVDPADLDEGRLSTHF